MTIIASAPRSAGITPMEAASALRDAPVLELERATTLPQVFRFAARRLVQNGFHQGDLLPDPFDRELTSLHIERPMSIVAAIRTAANGNPHIESPFSELAIRVLAYRLFVDEEGPLGDTRLTLALHVDDWGDQQGRTLESAVCVLEAAADASEASA
ncbi:hypothetical protein ACIGMX_35020 [Streptomyces aquilus]|uniref:DUF6197 family protein n=1 Tax=Streptomyces aquilus TaxID=2548456 RepID=UPI0037D80183